jgi:hypothetical protein
MIPNLHQILLDRLQQKGITNEASALLRDLAKILKSNPGIGKGTAKGKLLLDNHWKTTHF